MCGLVLLNRHKRTGQQLDITCTNYTASETDSATCRFRYLLPARQLYIISFSFYVCVLSVHVWIFIALHGMQRWSSNENSVCPSNVWMTPGLGYWTPFSGCNLRQWAILAPVVGWVTAPWMKNPWLQWYEAYRSCMLPSANKGVWKASKNSVK